MDFFQVVLILTGLTGVGFILYSIVNFHGKKQPDEARAAEVMEISRKIDVFDSTIKDADDLYNNLDSLKNDVMKEFDQKYQEMLFLYNLIDDKKKELADIDKIKPSFVSAPNVNEAVLENEMPDNYAVNIPEHENMNNEFSVNRAAEAEETEVAAPKKRGRPRKQPVIMNPKLEQIMKLKEEGETVAEIAKNLGMGKGEVMLLLNISGQK